MIRLFLIIIALFIFSINILLAQDIAKDDFNIGYLNELIEGNLSTNDVVIGNTNYTILSIMSTPLSSSTSLDLNTDGSYEIVGSVSGNYIYEIEVCQSLPSTDCLTSIVTINVLDFNSPNKKLIINNDNAITIVDRNVDIRTLSNDACAITNSCDLDISSVMISNFPSYGQVGIDVNTGDITYSPNNGFSGNDTLAYTVCVTGEPNNCGTAYQFISVVSDSSPDIALATDDLSVTGQEVSVVGNVIVNDMHTENNILTVVTQSISNSNGAFNLASDGSFSFIPNPWFHGNASYTYRVCAGQDCSIATLYLLVLKDLTLDIRAYLSGPLYNSYDLDSTNTRYLMSDNLRESPFTGLNYIPTKDPYQIAGSPIDVTDPKGNYVDVIASYIHVAPGDDPMFLEISDPTTVFSVIGQDAIVDWVFIELRDKYDNKSVIATRSALLQRDGNIVDIDGIHSLRFPGVDVDDYYVVVRHRNHLGVMSKYPVATNEYHEEIDFTEGTLNSNFQVFATFPTYDFGFNAIYDIDFTGTSQNPFYFQNNIFHMALQAGDVNADKRIKHTSPYSDLNNILAEVVFRPINTTYAANADNIYGYAQGDIDMNSRIKYINPHDDANLLHVIVQFHILNSMYTYNFNALIEQLPENLPN